MEEEKKSVAASAGLGALILGVVGFGAGFLGPIVLNPDANQGPLMGIFITAPGGAVGGAVLGALLAGAGLSAIAITAVLAGTALFFAATTLVFCLPQPEYRGNVVEIQVAACVAPASLKEEAFSYWDKRIADANWAAVRPGWKEGFEAMLAADPGVVILAPAKRSVGLYENRKPWNKGTFKAGKAWWVKERYFVGGATCADWPVGRTGIFAARGDARVSKQWPAEVLPNFLDLQVLTPATDAQAGLLR